MIALVICLMVVQALVCIVAILCALELAHLNKRVDRLEERQARLFMVKDS